MMVALKMSSVGSALVADRAELPRAPEQLPQFELGRRRLGVAGHARHWRARVLAALEVLVLIPRCVASTPPHAANATQW